MTSKKKQQNLYSTAAKRMASYQEEQAKRAASANRKGFDLKVALVAITSAIAISLVSQFAILGNSSDTSTEPTASASPAVDKAAQNSGEVPNIAIAEDRTWTGNIQLNDAVLPLTLFGDKAPQAVASFVTLSNKGFFNGVSCHRITTSGIFVLQCGDPKGDGTGGPGYSFGPIENAPAGDLYKRGYLAMARQGGNASSMGSQFFIVYADSTIPSDGVGGYTVFGEVGGLEKIQDIISSGTSSASGDGQPKVATVITGISVN